MSPVPTSTYRLQFDPAQLTLTRARGLVPYLARLGISHLYSSPLFLARPGSPHGYDVADPTLVNPELGGRPALEALVEKLTQERMHLLADIVPNHLVIGRHNPWWMEVLEHGPRAPHERFFDLFWRDGVLPLPLLGKPYAQVLQEGELSVVAEDDGLFLAYWEDRFPLDPATYPLVLDGLEGREQVTALARRVDAASEWERVSRGEAVKSALRGIDRSRLESQLEGLGPEVVHDVAEAQHYRLAWWQLSRERLGHRRFFTITELIGLRQQDPVVFGITHSLVRSLVGEGLVDGLRIDHVDGLADPLGYLRRLRREVWPDGGGFVVVEKILSPGEQLPADWPVEGTTGYEHAGAVGALFVDPRGYEEMASFYRRFTGELSSFEDLVHEQKRFILLERLGPETARFAQALEKLADGDRWARDVIPSQLTEAAVEVVAALPVYRTYAREGALPDEDRGWVEEALEQAQRRNPGIDPRAYDFLRRVLLLEEAEQLDPVAREERAEFVERVQQLSGATMAKGVEDTAFYQFNLLVSLNEVGSHPAPFPADPVAAYHQHNARVAECLPLTLTATSTHDTKRSEDVRARISALTQVPEEWEERVESWTLRNRRHRGSASAGAIPTRNEELFIYQTLVGSWPLERKDLDEYGERLGEHFVKAAREAKIHTAWLEPDLEHEGALTDFVAGLLGDGEFVEELERFAAPLWREGALSSLAQLALRLAAPGIPDVYQGQELWDLSLTDPDNRRPVDWERRSEVLDELERREGDQQLLDELSRDWEDGRIKLYLTWQGLRLRRRLPAVFSEGAYRPIEVEGERADHIVAFARQQAGTWVLAVAPRLTLGLSREEGLWPREGWDRTALALPREAPASWRSVLTGEAIDEGHVVPLSRLLGRFPVALLEGVEKRPS